METLEILPKTPREGPWRLLLRLGYFLRIAPRVLFFVFLEGGGGTSPRERERERAGRLAFFENFLKKLA